MSQTYYRAYCVQVSIAGNVGDRCASIVIVERSRAMPTHFQNINRQAPFNKGIFAAYRGGNRHTRGRKLRPPEVRGTKNGDFGGDFLY